MHHRIRFTHTRTHSYHLHTSLQINSSTLSFGCLSFCDKTPYLFFLLFIKIHIAHICFFFLSTRYFDFDNDFQKKEEKENFGSLNKDFFAHQIRPFLGDLFTKWMIWRICTRINSDFIFKNLYSTFYMISQRRCQFIKIHHLQ